MIGLTFGRPCELVHLLPDAMGHYPQRSSSGPSFLVACNLVASEIKVLCEGPIELKNVRSMMERSQQEEVVGIGIEQAGAHVGNVGSATLIWQARQCSKAGAHFAYRFNISPSLTSRPVFITHPSIELQVELLSQF